MRESIFSALVLNAALLLATIQVLSLALNFRLLDAMNRWQWLLGALLGLIGVGVMMASLRVVPGVVFDLRSVLLAITGLFFGALPATIAMAMTAAYRLSLGGVGAWTGVAVILASGGLGIAWRRWRRPRLEAVGWRELYALGLLATLALLALMLTLPGPVAREVLGTISLPVLVLYPVLTVALGLMFSDTYARRASQRTLRETEERYQILFNNSHTAMLVIDPATGAIVAANPAASSLYGWSPAQLARMTIGQINTLPPAELKEAMSRAVASGQSAFNFRHHVADGSIRDVEVHSGTVHVDGRALLYSIIHDVSERRRAEARFREQEIRRALDQGAWLEAQKQARLAALNLMEDAVASRARAVASLARLREGEQRLKLALHAANQGTFDLNVQTGEAIVSDEYADMLGYEPADFHETHAAWIGRMHPDDLARVTKTYEDYIAGAIPEYRVEFRQQTRSGEWKWLLSVGSLVARDDAGHPLRMLGTHTDIGPLKQSEARLERVTQLYSALGQCNQAIARCNTEAELFEQVCKVVVIAGGMKMAWIGGLDPARGTVEVLASHADTDEYLSAVRISTDAEDPLGQGPTAIAVREAQPFWCQDFLHDPVTAPWHARGAQAGWAASAALPLRRSGRVVGALTVYAGSVDAFDPEMKGLLVEIASDLGFALEGLAREEARRQADAERQKFVLLAQTSKDFIVLSNADFKPRFINPAGLRLVGLADLEAAGQFSPQDLFFPEDRDFIAHDFIPRALREGRNEVEIRFRHFQTGAPIWMIHSVTAIRDEHSALDVWATVSRDITQRRLAESQLRKLSLAVEQSAESILIADAAGNIEYMNDAFLRSTGYSREELIGQNPRVLQSGKTPPQTFAEMWEAISNGRSWTGEFINRRKDGSEFIEAAIVSPMRQPDGAITHYVAVKDDITDEKRVAEELDRHRHHLEALVASRTQELSAARQQADAASRAKTAFLANMSHEIRTPMNAIIGLSHLLRRAGATPQQSERLDKIDAAGRHLLSIIDDILDLSKIEADRLTLETRDFHLAQVLDSVAGLIAEPARDKGLSITVDGADVPPWLRGDPTRLRQACSTTPATPSSSPNAARSRCAPGCWRTAATTCWCASRCRTPASASPPTPSAGCSRLSNRPTPRPHAAMAAPGSAWRSAAGWRA